MVHLIYRCVAKASDYTVTWEQDGRLDFAREPLRPPRLPGEEKPCAASVTDGLRRAVDGCKGYSGTFLAVCGRRER